MNKSEVMVWIDQAIDRIAMRKFEDDSISSLSTIERLYLYTEIVLRYKLFISADQINKGIFSSRSSLVDYIAQNIVTPSIP